MGSDDKTVLDTEPTASTTAIQYSNVGDYPITLFGGSDDVYDFEYVSATLTIIKADAICNIEGWTGTYDAAAHGASGNCLGVQGEILTGLNLGDSYTNVPGGTADWTLTGETNYNDDSGSVAIVINKADATIVVTPYDVTYDATEHIATGTAKGVENEDLAGLDLSGTTHTNAGDYTDTWTFTDVTGNYNDDTDTVNDKIAKADPVCTITGYTGIYDAAAHGATGTCIGVEDETLAGLDLGDSFTNYPGGTANWIFTDVTGNYNDDSGSVEIIINKATLTVTADNKSFQYSDPVPALTHQITGFIGGELEADVVTGEPECTTTATQYSPAGNYPIVCTIGTLAADNYDFTFVDGTMTVTKEDTAIEYNGPLSVITAGSNINTAPVALSAHLSELDGDLGDLTKAKVTFTLEKVGGGAITVNNVAVSAAGDAIAITNVPVGVYEIKVTITTGNLYWIENPYGDGTLHVYAGTNEQRVTGGGWIPDANSANNKDNFGFTVTYKKNGAPQGNFLYMFRGTDGYNYKIKSNSWANGGLSFTGTNGAYFTAKATMSKINATTGEVVSSDGNFKFSVNIYDGDLAKPTKTPDTFAITIFDGSNNVWKQVGTAASQINLGGGNIDVKSK
jgi:hypothetical protein